jgi:hypothetical protein
VAQVLPCLRKGCGVICLFVIGRFISGINAEVFCGVCCSLQLNRLFFRVKQGRLKV